MALYPPQEPGTYAGTERSAHIRREIRWSLVFPLLSLAGIVLAMLQLVGSVAIYVLAPVIMTFMFWSELA